MEVRKCQRCGASLVGRPSATKWCLDCSVKASTEALNRKKEIRQRLEARDKRLEPIDGKCGNCHILVHPSDNFCRFCGQRLRGEGFECLK